MLDLATDVGARERTMFCLMLEGGLRLAEAFRLKVANVHF
jgi:site-specific recombinase XerD